MLAPVLEDRIEDSDVRRPTSDVRGPRSEVRGRREQQDSGTWSAYAYTGPKFKTGPGIPIYASDGVENNALAEGMVVYRAILPKPGSHVVDHLNPQTMEE